MIDINFKKEGISNRTSLSKNVNDWVWVLNNRKSGEILVYNNRPLYFTSFSEAYRFLYMAEESKDYYPVEVMFDDSGKVINLDGCLLYHGRIELINDSFLETIEKQEEYPIYCKFFDNDTPYLRTSYMHYYEQSEMEILYPSLQPYWAMSCLRIVGVYSINNPEKFDHDQVFMDKEVQGISVIGSCNPLFSIKIMNNGMRRIIFPDGNRLFPFDICADARVKIQLTEIKEEKDDTKK